MGIFRQAHGAGYRAGMTSPKWRQRSDDTKVMVQPENPYKGRWQFLLHMLWEFGYDEGFRKRILGSNHA